MQIMFGYILIILVVGFLAYSTLDQAKKLKIFMKNSSKDAFYTKTIFNYCLSIISTVGVLIFYLLGFLYAQRALAPNSFLDGEKVSFITWAMVILFLYSRWRINKIKY